MSKVGRRPIQIPPSVRAQVQGQQIKITGPKGELSAVIAPKIRLEQTDKELRLEKKANDKQTRALLGTWRAHLANMVKGVTEGFVRELELVGVGYRAALSGNSLRLEVGYSHPIEVPIPGGLEVEVPESTKIIIKGIDKQKVGQFSAVIRKVRPPEPYKGKGIRYKDELVKLKPGKAGKEA